MLMSDLERRHSGSEKTHIVVGDALHLGPETQAVRDDKAKITDLRDVNSGIIGFINDAVTEGEPKARRAQRASDGILRAACPGWADAGLSRSIGLGVRCARVKHPSKASASNLVLISCSYRADVPNRYRRAFGRAALLWWIKKIQARFLHVNFLLGGIAGYLWADPVGQRHVDIGSFEFDFR